MLAVVGKIERKDVLKKDVLKNVSVKAEAPKEPRCPTVPDSARSSRAGIHPQLADRAHVSIRPHSRPTLPKNDCSCTSGRGVPTMTRGEPSRQTAPTRRASTGSRSDLPSRRGPTRHRHCGRADGRTSRSCWVLGFLGSGVLGFSLPEFEHPAILVGRAPL